MTSTLAANATGLPVRPPLDVSTFPDIYGMSVRGACMAPEIPDGCNIKISKTDGYDTGDIICVWFRSEFVRPGAPAAMIKRLAMKPPPWVQSFPYNDHPNSDVRAVVMLVANDQPEEWLSVRCSAILAIHKVRGILKPQEIGADYRDEVPPAFLRSEDKRRRLASSKLRAVTK